MTTTTTITGGYGALTAEQLPAGCVTLTIWPTPGSWHDDEVTHFWGEIVEENDDAIRIRVFGDTMTKLKSRVRLTRSAVDGESHDSGNAS